MRLAAPICILLPVGQYVAANPKPAPNAFEAVGVVVTKYVVAPDFKNRSLICMLDAVLLAFKAIAAKASLFCSSYLHIPTSPSKVIKRPNT